MQTGIVKKIDDLMSPDRDCGSQTHETLFRYLVCSTPRCGSNLLSDLLHQTGKAGDPMEYLNSRYIAGFLRQKGVPEGHFDLSVYLDEIERRRSTNNGCFGLKMHFEHMGIWGSNIGSKHKEFLRQFNKVILLRRKDKLAQAVSLYKARTTQIWSSRDYIYLENSDPRRHKKVKFDSRAIAQALADIFNQEVGGKTLLNLCSVDYYEIWYEDLLLDQAGEYRKLLDFLCLGRDVALDVSPTVIRQGHDNDPMVQQFKRAIGVSDRCEVQGSKEI